MWIWMYLPSLSLRSGILLSMSCTAGITWSYMCKSGLQLSEKLLWCSSSQCSSNRHSLNKHAAVLCHHGGEGFWPVSKHNLLKNVILILFKLEIWQTCGVCQLLRTTKIQPLSMEDYYHCLHHLSEKQTEQSNKLCKSVTQTSMWRRKTVLPHSGIDRSCAAWWASSLISESSFYSANAPPGINKRAGHFSH